MGRGDVVDDARLSETEWLRGVESYTILKPRQPWLWFGSCAVIVASVWVAYQLAFNKGFQWDIVWKYLFAERVVDGAIVTGVMTIVAMTLGILGGILLAVFVLSKHRTLSYPAHAFLWFFRGTPVLVQLIFWYNLGSLFPQIEFGIPFGGPKFAAIDSTAVLGSLTASVIGLSLNESAYMAEIVRAGFISVPRGQEEAAKALGLRSGARVLKITLPQAMRIIVPPTGNQFIGMLKFTSLASFIALQELLWSVQSIYNQNFKVVPLLIVASIWYLAMTGVLTWIQRYVEKYYAKGYGKSGPSRRLRRLMELRSR